MSFEIVVAHNSRRGIGCNNALPWSCPEDMAFFKKLTQDSAVYNAVVMGSNTWRSIGGRPLPGRLNVVLSTKLRRDDLPDGVMLFDSVKKCVRDLLTMGLDNVYIIGGASVYSQFMKLSVVSTIHANEILHSYTLCNTHLDEIPSDFRLVNQRSSKDVVYRTYQRPQNLEEMSYLRLVGDILREGEHRGDRTGTGTISMFGKTMRFSLRGNRIPMLTTKKVFWAGVAKELLWFISGSTDANKLAEQGVNIWKENGSREFLDNMGFHDRKEGDLGPVYGFQWRHFGADYVDCNTDYRGKGFDQLRDCIDKIKNDPTSRRIIMSAWNPPDLGAMNLAPCHMMCQFYVSDTELSCQMYQRSCDVGLGVPFNIASYALLTHMVAHCCGLRAKELVYVMGDAHIYKNHVEHLCKQLAREPLEFPTVRLTESVRDIDDFRFGDIELLNYYHHKAIRMPFSA